MRLILGNRRFAPSLSLTALMLVLCVVFVALGRWQWRRGETRQAVQTRFEQGAQRLVSLGAAPLHSVPVYQRVRLDGTFDPAHQFLIDNSTHRDRDGYQVLTPLERPNGEVVLVDRGWVPFTGSRAHLPDIALQSAGVITVSGRVGNLPAAGLKSGRAPPAPGASWPKVTSFPSMSQLSVALGQPLPAHLILLDPKDPNGYVRDWQLPGLRAMQNFGYAFQWWCFAVAAGVIWMILSTHRLEKKP